MPDARVIAGSPSWATDLPRPVVTIGNFDGVHLGHRALLERTVVLADELGATPTAFTFHPAPRDVLRPGNPVQRLQTIDDRVRWLGEHGMAHVVVEPFSREYAAHDAEWFARVVLAERLRAAAVVVGWDFRFGRGRGGSVDTLRRVLDVPVEQVSARTLLGDDAPVSSSRIRQAVERGDIAEANRLLDRPHEVTGRVVHGDARGRGLGVRTANVDPSKVGGVTTLLPPLGVYAVRMELDGAWHPGVANLGVRPTFNPSAAEASGDAPGSGPDAPPDVRLEVHLLAFEGDLYDTTVRVAFIERLRDERRFETSDALVAQIRQDVARAREVLGLHG